MKTSQHTLFENLIWLDSKETAEYLRTTPGNIRVMVCRGILKAYKLNNRNRFRKNELDALLESSLNQRSTR